MEPFVKIVLMANMIMTIVGTLISIAMVGKQREPLTPAAVIIGLLINTVIVIALILVLMGAVSL